MNSAAADLKARDQQLAHDQALAQQLADLAAQQQAEAKQIAQLAQQPPATGRTGAGRSARAGPGAGHPGGQQGQPALQQPMAQAWQQLAESQRATQQAAEEIAGQSIPASPAIGQAEQLAEALIASTSRSGYDGAHANCRRE